MTANEYQDAMELIIPLRVFAALRGDTRPFSGGAAANVELDSMLHFENRAQRRARQATERRR